jgi:MFS transporter, DHA2 family, multidrug resistance protein
MGRTKSAALMPRSFFVLPITNAGPAAQAVTAWVGKALQQQVELLAYIDVCWTLAIVAVLMIATAAVLRPIDLHAPARGH